MRKRILLTNSPKPTVALTLGDPSGIGPELIAKLLTRSDVIGQATVVLVGDSWLWEEGQAIAGVSVATRTVDRFDEVRSFPDGVTPIPAGRNHPSRRSSALHGVRRRG